MIIQKIINIEAQYINMIYYNINAYINIIISDVNITIVNLTSYIKNKGYASQLLKHVINISILKKLPIILDDMSDHFRNNHNIYIKHGFKYIYDEGPEMIRLNIKII